MINIAVLGTGSIGMRHLRTFSLFENVSVYAIPIRTNRVDELRSQGYKSFLNFEYIPKIDGIVIATNTGRHLGDIRNSLSFCAKILVEKPLATSTTGVKNLLDEISDSKQNLFVGCCLRFDKSLLEFKKHLHQAGTIYSVEITCRSYLPAWRPDRDYRTGYAASVSEGGVLRDLIHEIDYALWLYGSTNMVFGKLMNSGILEVPTEDQATLFWKSNKNININIQLDYLSRKPIRQMTAYGSEGNVSVDLIKNNVMINKPDSQPTILVINPNPDQMYFDQAKAFLRSIENHDPGQLASGIEGLEALAVCDAARRSSVSLSFEQVIL